MEKADRTIDFNHSRPQDLSALSPSMSIDRLFPALLECFGIILCGYIAGRANIITGTQAKGLGNFVSKFALPALLFKNMVLLDFDNVIWPFLWSILIAKVCVFAIVAVLTLIVSSPDSRYSKAGIFSIFSTQSNDFALGYPIGKLPCLYLQQPHCFSFTAANNCAILMSPVLTERFRNANVYIGPFVYTRLDAQA